MTWARVDGVVELPDGRRVRGRGLGRTGGAGTGTVLGTGTGEAPEFGVYLLGRAPELPWEHRWVRCPDFRTPHDRAAAAVAVREAFERAAVERVEFGCGGGVGRTGMALALAARLGGVPADEAVEWVRRNYHPRAVETPWQRRWVRTVPLDARR